MSLSRRLSVAISIVLVLVAGVAGVGAQSPDPVDPWQFPNLVDSRPFQRWWWGFQQRAYPLAEIPANAKSRALEQIKRTKTAQGAVAGNIWVNIGPAPELGGQIGSTGGTRPMSGRVTAIAAHPADANRWLVAAAQGGIWETLDAGATWTAKTDNQATLAMGALVFAPSDSTIVYAGTGESNRSNDSYGGAGLLKSTDGGSTWTLLAASTFAKNSFSALKVDPNNASILLAAITTGVFGRVSVFAPSPPRGVHRSTDGGVSWVRTRDGAASDLATDPTNFNHQYAGVGDTFQSATNNLVRSIDGGQTWDVITGPWSQAQVGRISLAIAPSQPNTLYVAIQRAFNSGGGSAEGALLGLFRTDNAWSGTPTFISIPQPPATGTFGFCGFDVSGAERDGQGRFASEDEAAGSPSQQCWYDMVLTVDPGNPNTLYAGGVQLWKCTGCGASPTWTEVSKQVSAPAQGIHVDQHAAAWAGGRLIIGNDGGVWSTTDGGANWADHNTNLSTIQFFDGSLHPTDPNFALGGAQDNGTMKWTGSAAWSFIEGGDGAASAISSSSPNTNWAVSSQNLDIERTTNGGASFITATSGIDQSDAPFISRFEKCPANDNVFISGTTRIWRSTNFFSATPPTWSDNNSGSFNSNVSGMTFAGSDTSCNTYAAGSGNGTLRVTVNGGTMWTNLDAGGAVPNRAVTDLAFHPTNPNVLYVTLSGFDEGTPGQPGHLFKTTNALAASPTWTNVSPPVNLPHNTIAIDPTSPNTLYVGTDLGVWTSTDGGGTWGHMGPETGMPNVAVFDLKVNPTGSRVVAFTHGRGAFALTTATLTAQVSVNPSSFTNGQTLVAGGTVNNPGNPGSADFYVGILRPDGSTIQFFTPTGIVIGSLANLGSFRPLATGIPLGTPFSVNQPGFYTHQWVAGDPRGPYVFFIAVLRAGAVADGVVSSDEIIALATAPFSVQ